MAQILATLPNLGPPGLREVENLALLAAVLVVGQMAVTRELDLRRARRGPSVH